MRLNYAAPLSRAGRPLDREIPKIQLNSKATTIHPANLVFFCLMATDDLVLDGETVTESETKLKKPPLYRVLLHNDDFTTMEFVVYVLQTIFGRTTQDATVIMLRVHTEGVGVAGVYTLEVAEMKVSKVMALARANEYPLLCTVEESGAE
jgi:ATP-dependent Clp protease adaptor protein ClpS